MDCGSPSSSTRPSSTPRGEDTSRSNLNLIFNFMMMERVQEVVMIGWVWAVPAQACGGFFCSNVPVEQAGEDILFAVDSERAETTVHVQIEYSGPAEEFAWVVPVPALPEVALSSDTLFQRLQSFSSVAYELDVGAEECLQSVQPPAPPPEADGGSVLVASEDVVGPYDSAVLRARTSADLLDWLQDNGFDLPAELDPVLAPYVAEESWFVALKLRKGQDTGALQPIALTYPGTAMSVPIQLTSIAASPDMRLGVYVLGEHRAVPDSYLHVTVDDLVMAGSPSSSWPITWEEAITRAADEAGGHAFATESSWPTESLQIFDDTFYDPALLAATADPVEFFGLLMNMGFVGDAQMLELWRQFLPLPEEAALRGLDETSFYNCLACYPKVVAMIPFDAAAFAAAIDEQLAQPLIRAQALVDKLPWLTRMTSSVSPWEMTVDPTFVFNADIPQTVDRLRLIRLDFECIEDEHDYIYTMTLPDGRSYVLPSNEELDERNVTLFGLLEPLMTHYALRIEDMSSSGPPLVLVDYQAEADALAAGFDAFLPEEEGPTPGPYSGVTVLEPPAEPARGCGCGGGAPVSLLALGLPLLGLRRRRS
jgi:hypothetical protein